MPLGRRGKGEAPPDAGTDGATKPNDEARKVKYVKPKVLAVDLSAPDFETIEDGGFNVHRGTFGRRYVVPRSNQLRYVPQLAVLPNAEEQEIIIVDLAHKPPSQLPTLPDPPIGTSVVWQRLGSGLFDLRPRAMWAYQDDFDRIYENGWIFIVFADRRVKPDYSVGEAHNARGGVNLGRNLDLSNWCFLTSLDRFRIADASGSEIHTSGERIATITQALESGAEYRCLVEPPSWLQDRWLELARTKYGDPIAGVLAPDKEESRQGWILVLPQVENKGALARALLEDLLPRLSPKLFPQDDRQAWVNNDAYALPGVLELQGQIRKAEEEAEVKIHELREQITKKREERRYLHQILTAEGDELVDAVKQTLESLGFDEIVDVDKAEAAEDGRLREDLRITHEAETVLIEVKGITNTPRDTDALQVGKYIPVRIKEWKDPEVRGLSIINHQKGLPPLERQDETVFHEDIETNAQTLDFGLLTTWDLYRLSRNFERLGWKHEDIRKLLLTTKGRIEPIPAHYEFVGLIENYFAEPEVIAIQLGKGTKVSAGDTLAYQLPIDFFEEEVASIQIDGEQVQEAAGEKLIGVKTTLARDQARNKTRVFRVRPA
jgi:hypothetical protein